jgi:hypothetical protein
MSRSVSASGVGIRGFEANTSGLSHAREGPLEGGLPARTPASEGDGLVVYGYGANESCRGELAVYMRGILRLAYMRAVLRAARADGVRRAGMVLAAASDRVAPRISAASRGRRRSIKPGMTVKAGPCPARRCACGMRMAGRAGCGQLADGDRFRGRGDSGAFGTAPGTHDSVRGL